MRTVDARFGHYKAPPGTKFGNIKVKTDEGIFDSKKEYRRWCDLKLLQRVGEIRNLERQVPFSIIINGKECGTYKADFAYFRGEQRVIEDAKSSATEADKYWRFKKKVIEALYDFEIRVV